MLKSKNTFTSYFLIFIIILIGYWQVSFLVYGLKWDLIDVVLPFRYYFSESIQSGHFPFWNPFQQTGTPFFADLQAPTYYPELIITSLLGGYGIYTMHVLFIIYLLIAATGMYKLSFHFNKCRYASMIAGLAYAFSGYIIGHGQHFFLLVGAAWIPFVILYYIKLNQEKRLINSLKSGVFIFLMVTGSYQALSIVMLYLLVLIFFYFLISTLLERKTRDVLQIIKLNIYASIIIMLLCLPLIISTFEILDSTGRLSEGIGLEKTLAFGQPYTTFLSFILPFSTLKYNELFGNIDLSMINHYVGLIPLVFFILSLFRKHSILEYLILVFGLVIFAMSFDFLPVRAFMYHYIPLMDSFLYGAYLRIYGLMAIILFAANYFAHFQKDITKNKIKPILISILLLIVLLLLTVASIDGFSDKNFDYKNIKSLLTNLTFHQSVVIQATFQSLILAGLIAVIAFHKKIRYPRLVIILLLTVEVVAAAQLNMHATVINTKHKATKMQADLSLCPENFPIPIDDKIIFNDSQHAFFKPFWRNTYIFTKQISFNSFSSFGLNTYNKLDEYTGLKNAVLDNHLFYFSDSILALNNLYNKATDDSIFSKQLYFRDTDYKRLSDIKVKTDSTDNYQILDFAPNKVTIQTSTKHSQFLTMLQTNYKGWKAYIDNKPVPIYTSNFNYRTILLPEGKHVVKYKYENDKILVSYILSNVIFIICIIFLLGHWLYYRKKGSKAHIYIPLALLITMALLTIKNFSYKKKYKTVHEFYDARYPSENAAFTKKLDFETVKNNNNSSLAFSGNKSLVVNPETKIVPIIKLVQKNNRIKPGTLKVTAKIYTKSYCKVLIVSKISKKWHANKIERQIEELNQWNEVIYVRKIPKMNDGEILKVHLWNLNKSKFRVDNISVELFEE